MVFPEIFALHDTACSLQDPPPPLLFASRHVTALKSQYVPRAEVQSVTHEQVPYSPKKLRDFFQFSQTGIPRECMWNGY